jgi:hypothetical protein
MRTALLSILFTFLINAGFAQTIPADSMYLSQTTPGIIPTIFNLQITSGLIAAERISITADNKEIYYGELDTWPATVQRIKYYKYLENKWQGPFVAFDGYIAPSLSPNDSIMYMQKNLNNNTLTSVFYSVRTTTGWSEPKRLLSTTQQTHYFQETNLKNFYTASSINAATGSNDLYKLNINNFDTTFQNLGTPLNTSAIENDFYIARDESYMIICRFPSGSASDLYISYKKDNCTWTNPKTLGTQVNTPNPNWEACPFVTKDNKYLFFMRGGIDMASYHIYWVNINNLIDSLKLTNYVPYIKTAIPNQSETVGQSVNFTIPDSTFIDDDGNNTLTYSATLSNGSALPSWLNFDPATKTFTGTPTATANIFVKVKVTDTENASVFSTFNLKIISSTSVNQTSGQNIQIFPNPTKNKFNITFGDELHKNIQVEITDIKGKLIFSNNYKNISGTSIDFTNQEKGIYFINFNIDDKIIRRKICLI